MTGVEILEPTAVGEAGRGAAPLSLVLQRERGGPAISVTPIPQRALGDALAELWFDAHLRRGSLATGLGQTEAELRPVFRPEDSGRICTGFELTMRDASGRPVTRRFDRTCLSSLAASRADRLLDAGILEPGDLYFYRLEPASDGSLARLRGPAGRGVPELLRAPLRPLLERANAGVERARALEPYPVFFTRAARERAERVSRKGADAAPPVETGGLLIGPLCSCPETGEVFGVVVDVIEATGSEATTYSLGYSGDTWARIQTILRARRAQPAMRTHRILGQCHGHNFLPLGGAEPCAMCAHVEVCTRTSAHLSEDDRTWCRAHFAAEPWQLSWVFGLDARGGSVSAFYGQRGGLLERRGYHVVEDVDDLMRGGS